MPQTFTSIAKIGDYILRTPALAKVVVPIAHQFINLSGYRKMGWDSMTWLKKRTSLPKLLWEDYQPMNPTLEFTESSMPTNYLCPTICCQKISGPNQKMTFHTWLLICWKLKPLLRKRKNWTTWKLPNNLILDWIIQNIIQKNYSWPSDEEKEEGNTLHYDRKRFQIQYIRYLHSQLTQTLLSLSYFLLGMKQLIYL